MVHISNRSVYLHILEKRPIKEFGRKYHHVLIAQGMGLPTKSALVKKVLDWLIEKGYVQIFKKILTITDEIDPETLSDEEVTSSPPPDILPVLTGRSVHLRSVGRTLTVDEDAGHAEAVDETVRAETTIPVGAEPGADDATLPAEATKQVGAEPAADETRERDLEPVTRRKEPRRPERRRAAKPVPPPSAKMRAENLRLAADNARLGRELEAAKRLAEKQAVELGARRVPVAAQLISYLVQLITAMRFQYAGEIARSAAEVKAARQSLSEAKGMIRTLERRPTSDNAGELRRLEGEVRRLTSRVETLTSENRRLGLSAEELRSKNARLERDSEYDYGQLTLMRENLIRAEETAAWFIASRLVQQLVLKGCGHIAVVLVDPKHRPKSPVTPCSELELTEIVR